MERDAESFLGMYEFADLNMCSLLTEKLEFVGCSVLKSSHLEIRRLER